MTVPRMMRRSLLALIVTVAILSGCGPSRLPGERGAIGPSAGPTATPSSASDDPRYEATATVLESHEHGPLLCLGVILNSYPPQCGDVPITNWDWAAVPGEETAGSTVWGSYTVEGTYDGTSFTVLDARVPEPDPEPSGDGEDPFASPCPEPEGGWQAGGTEGSRAEAIRAAKSQPDFSGAWVDHVGDTRPEDPGALYVLNLAFTGSLERHEAELREIWDGPLCVSRQAQTYRELRRIQRETFEDIGLKVLTSGIDETDNVVDLEVIAITPEQRGALDARYGKGAIRVSAVLREL